MNMKLSQVALAISASLAIAPAFAVSGGASLTTLYGVPASNIVYISGASALSSSFANVVGTSCSTTGTQFGLVPAIPIADAKVVSLTIGGSNSDGRVIVCRTKSTPGGQFTAPFAVVKRDVNGSFDGVGPVINQIGEGDLKRWADVKNLNTTASHGCTPALPATGDCALNSVNVQKPHAGLSDVDTNVWRGMDATHTNSLFDVAGNPLTVKQTNAVSFNSGFAGQGFGVMVSESLYNAMINKQKGERIPSDCVAGDFVPGRCQPSITKEEYAAVVADGLFTYVAPGAINPGSLNPLTGVADDIINVCRRAATSGTQASSNVYFLHNSCANADPTRGFKLPKRVAIESGGTAVSWSTPTNNITGNYDDNSGLFGLFEGSGTGDARNCVIRRNTGKNPNNVADALGTYAMGWISLENAPAAGWKLIKLDGVSPNATSTWAGNVQNWAADTNQRLNVVRSYYDAAPELEMLWPTPSPYSAFLTSLKNTFANPSLVSLRGVFQANGAFTHALNPTEVHKGTRGGNFCAPQALAE